MLLSPPSSRQGTNDGRYRHSLTKHRSIANESLHDFLLNLLLNLLLDPFLDLSIELSLELLLDRLRDLLNKAQGQPERASCRYKS